jgi:hypothetical protein
MQLSIRNSLYIRPHVQVSEMVTIILVLVEKLAVTAVANCYIHGILGSAVLPCYSWDTDNFGNI